MRYSIVFSTALVAGVSGHGIIRNIVGANNVSMPGLGSKYNPSSVWPKLRVQIMPSHIYMYIYANTKD